MRFSASRRRAAAIAIVATVMLQCIKYIAVTTLRTTRRKIGRTFRSCAAASEASLPFVHELLPLQPHADADARHTLQLQSRAVL